MDSTLDQTNIIYSKLFPDEQVLLDLNPLSWGSSRKPKMVHDNAEQVELNDKGPEIIPIVDHKNFTTEQILKTLDRAYTDGFPESALDAIHKSDKSFMPVDDIHYSIDPELLELLF